MNHTAIKSASRLRRLARSRRDPGEGRKQRSTADQSRLRDLRAIPRRAFCFAKEHPRGLGIALGVLLAVILVIGNLRSASVFLLVGDVSLPLIAWALIFAVLGYATGKWIEWSLRWRQALRVARKGAPPEPSQQPSG